MIHTPSLMYILVFCTVNSVGFMLYMEECYKEVSDLHDYPAADVRTSAVAGVSNFCQAVGAVAKNTNSVEAQTGRQH